MYITWGILLLGAVLGDKLALGTQHACAISTANSLHCWGYSEDYQFGLRNVMKSVPYFIPLGGGQMASSVAVGERHSCILTLSGQWRCAGVLATMTRTTFSTMMESGVFTVLSSGAFSACAYGAGPGLLCVGNNDQGQLGDGSTSPSSLPVTATILGVGSVFPVEMLALGKEHSCVLSQGRVYCTGDNVFGQLGIQNLYQTTQFQWSGLEGVSAIRAGSYHTCALVSQSVYCTGIADTFGPTTDTTTFQVLPQQAFHLYVTMQSTFLHTTRGIEVLGTNTLGSAATGNESYPLSFPTPTVFEGEVVGGVEIKGNYVTTCLLNTTAGDVQCVGDNYYSIRGLGELRTVPKVEMSRVVGLPWMVSFSQTSPTGSNGASGMLRGFLWMMGVTLLFVSTQL